MSKTIDSEKRERMFKYLDRLRESGKCNMMEGARYLVRDFGLDKYEAEEVMFAWMDDTDRHGGDE